MSETDLFKQGMRRLTAGVCIITTGGGADSALAGLTATAVCSVSADPPTLLCCLNRDSVSLSAVLNNGVFGVNVLALEDRSLADRFAGRMTASEKFEAGLWEMGDFGAPLLEGALAAFACTLSQHVVVGTHGVIFGEVRAVRLRDAGARPLLYAHGAYGEFSGVNASLGGALAWLPAWSDESSTWDVGPAA